MQAGIKPEQQKPVFPGIGQSGEPAPDFLALAVRKQAFMGGKLAVNAIGAHGIQHAGAPPIIGNVIGQQIKSALFHDASMARAAGIGKARQCCRRSARIARDREKCWVAGEIVNSRMGKMKLALENFAAHLFDNLTDSEWWAGELPSWLVFVVVAGLFSAALNHWFEHRRNRQYQGWNLVMVGFDDAQQQLYFEEVRGFLNSDFELWKFVKSVVSGACLVKLRSFEKARGIWGFVDRQTKTITVDFEKIPDSQIERWLGAKPLNRPDAVPDRQPSA